MAEPVKLLMLVGAATPPGRLAAAIAAAAEMARTASGGVAVDILNLADTPIDTCDGRPLDAYGAATRGAVARIASAAAVLIAAPVYRASFPGVLKNLLDITPVEALQNKPVGIVAMGGSPHHYLAVDSQLRAVLAWFGALVAPTGVYLTGGDFRDGQLASEGARKDLAALTGTLVALARRLDPAALGPPPLAAKFT
ncbi:MAG TPA: NADPH-dependent FMN reductase [Stellaceae bacterium]|jgi:FMN reductase|nr:NADPH-dependent FMN reductase [Stellaceae bacterium]